MSLDARGGVWAAQLVSTAPTSHQPFPPFPPTPKQRSHASPARRGPCAGQRHSRPTPIPNPSSDHTIINTPTHSGRGPAPARSGRGRGLRLPVPDAAEHRQRGGGREQQHGGLPQGESQGACGGIGGSLRGLDVVVVFGVSSACMDVDRGCGPGKEGLKADKRRRPYTYQRKQASPPPLTSPTASVAHNSPEQPPQQPLQQAPPPPPPHQQPPQQPAYTFYYYHPNQQPQPQQDGATLLPLHIVPVPAGSAPAMGAWSAAMHASMQQQQQQLQQQQQQQTMPWQPAHGPTQPPALPLPPPPPHGMAMRPYMPTLPPLQQVLPAGAPVYQLADKRAWGCGGAPAGPSGSISSSMRQISTGTNTPPTTSSSSSSSSTAPSSRPPRHAAAAGPMVAPASTGAKAASLSAAAAEIEAVFPSLPAPGSTVGPAGADATGGAGRPSMRRLERVVSTSIPGTGVFVYVPPDAARPLLSPQEEEEKGERPEGWGRREPPTPSRRRRGAEAAGAGASSPEGDARRKRLQPQRQERGFTELDGEAQLVMSREVREGGWDGCLGLDPWNI